MVMVMVRNELCISPLYFQTNLYKTKYNIHGKSTSRTRPFTKESSELLILGRTVNEFLRLEEGLD